MSRTRPTPATPPRSHRRGPGQSWIPRGPRLALRLGVALRIRGQPKAHLQHVLTAIAVNIERLSQLSPGESTPHRPLTASQDYLDQHDVKRLRSWRAVSYAVATGIPDRVKLRP